MAQGTSGSSFQLRDPLTKPSHELSELENKPKLIDSSDSLFSMYNQRKKEHDEKMTDNWKDDAKGILVFVRENNFLSPRLDIDIS